MLLILMLVFHHFYTAKMIGIVVPIFFIKQKN